MVECECALLITLLGALNLLTLYGVKPFYTCLKNSMEDVTKSASARSKFTKELEKNYDMQQYYERFKKIFDNE